LLQIVRLMRNTASTAELEILLNFIKLKTH